MTLPRQLRRTKNGSRLRPIKSPLASVSMRISNEGTGVQWSVIVSRGLAPFETGIVDAAGDALLAAPVKVRAGQSPENRLATLNMKNRVNRTQVSSGSQCRPLLAAQARP